MSITLNDAFNEEYDDIVQEGSTKQTEEREISENEGGVNDDSVDNGVVVQPKSAPMRSRSAGDNNYIPIGEIILRNKQNKGPNILAIKVKIGSNVTPEISYTADFYINSFGFNERTALGLISGTNVDCFVSYSDFGEKYNQYYYPYRFRYSVKMKGYYKLSTDAVSASEYISEGRFISDISDGSRNIVKLNTTIDTCIEFIPIKIDLITYHQNPPSLYSITQKFVSPFVSILFYGINVLTVGDVPEIRGNCQFNVSDKRVAISDKNGEPLDYKIRVKFKFYADRTYYDITAESRLNLPVETNNYSFGAKSGTDTNPMMFQSDAFYQYGVSSNIRLISVTIESQMIDGEEVEKYQYYTMIGVNLPS
jgi:hypothetical protein